MDAISGTDGIDDRCLAAPSPGTSRFAPAADSVSNCGSPLEGYKIGLLVEGLEHDIVEKDVKEIVLESARKFETLGATVTLVSVPAHLEGPAIWSCQQRFAGTQNLLGRQHGRHGLYLSEFDRARLPWTTESFRKLFPSTQNVIINGLYLEEKFPGLYGKTMNLARWLRDSYEDVLKTVDVLVTPTTPRVAPRHGTRSTPMESLKPSMGMTLNTCGLNVTGHPALTIPVGFAAPPRPGEEDIRLPVGMQIIGPLFQDEKALKVGRAWESNFDWRDVSKKNT